MHVFSASVFFLVEDAGDARRDREFEWKVGSQKITRCICHLTRHQFEISLIAMRVQCQSLGAPRCNCWQRSNNTFRRFVTTLVRSARQKRIPVAPSRHCYGQDPQERGKSPERPEAPPLRSTSQASAGSSLVQAQKANGNMTSGQPRIQKDTVIERLRRFFKFSKHVATGSILE